MTESNMKLARAPIIEAILDIDCDLPPSLDIQALEKPARDCFRNEYSKFRPQYFLKQHVEAKAEEPLKTSTRSGILGYQFLHEDGKQVVQVRDQGFSFNRLAPYSCLDDYLPEIERTWNLFLGLLKPVRVRIIRLRYINRLPLPADEDKVDLDDFLKIGPRLPDENHLKFVGFLNQCMAVDPQTGNEVKTILASQVPVNNTLPVIFDITVADTKPVEPEDWDVILSKIRSLRKLKNRVFRDTLTERCLQQFQ